MLQCGGFRVLTKGIGMAEPEDRNNRRPDGQEAVPTADYGAAVGPGAQIGPYKLTSILGEGGYGIVYLAEQQRPVKRRVALKIIKPGMNSKQVIARFEAERQALALLDHPNIAHVFNAGTTEASRPYFVMEHVKGIPVTEHCDRHKLTIEERLKLFLQVCEAVQYAHQKGIIHRDIKPSNILVTLEADRAIPMIIDFGVAKAISQPLTERTLVTEQGQFVGTPEYMSPEQADLTTQDVDTRSDVYSLGVVLYELLTGALPFDPEALRKGGIEHIRHVICEEEPKTPSTRLSTASGRESTKLAQLRRTDARTLGRQLHGDLDWITLKAMEKDQTRRYQTAHALAEDIQRHLENEPVLAGPPSKIYRLKKFVHRHRAQAAGAAVAGILLAVIAVISILYVQAANRNRAAESLEHADILSKARESRSKGQFDEALAHIDTIVGSEHVGAEARLLRAQIVLRLRGPSEAIGPLEELTKEQDDIACQAHFLLARIYLETKPDNPQDIPEYQQTGRAHQQVGEELFSESPEAYFNRSMMTGTVSKSLEYLEEALKLDPGHYPSRRARSLAYYALKDYRNMERDAVAMTVLRDWDPLGYSLLAIALREADDVADALRYHNRAIRISPDEPGLYDQRRRTYMIMADYEQALSDAQECVQLQPDETVYHFNVFCALVALGRFEQAQARWDIAGPFGGVVRRYVFDTLGAGRSWHPPGNTPKGVAFLPMVEADEDYRRLAKKARRVVPDGANPTWSPDGTELVYSRGVTGFSGIEIVNVETGKTRLLTVPGWDPSWSPDKRYIAFVRCRQVLLLADLTTEHAARVPSHEEREVWIIKSDGTEEPSFLTQGHWPYWSRDSKRIFYYRSEAKKIYSISIQGESEPKPVAWCWGFYPAVSPDGKCFCLCLGLFRAASRGGHLVGIADPKLGRATRNGFRTLVARWSPVECGRGLGMEYGALDIRLENAGNLEDSQWQGDNKGPLVTRWEPDGPGVVATVSRNMGR